MKQISDFGKIINSYDVGSFIVETTSSNDSRLVYICFQQLKWWQLKKRSQIKQSISHIESINFIGSIIIRFNFEISSIYRKAKI